MRKTGVYLIVVSLWLVTMPVVAGAQTNISGTAECDKASIQSTIEVGDRPDHSFMVSRAKCTWTKPWKIEGIQNKKGVATAFDEISGNSSRFHGFFLDSMANGDKAHYRYEGTATFKDGVTQSVESKWKLVGGTGKLKGIKGKGTCKGKGSADGSITYQCKGEYQLPK